MQWVDTTGGPHVLIAEELLPRWCGIEEPRDETAPSAQSDYARACEVADWQGLIPCDGGSAVVLGGDVGPVAWFAGERLLVQWIGADDERQIIEAAGTGSLIAAVEQAAADEITFSTGPSGRMRLLDSTDVGSNLLGDSLTLQFPPGDYRMRAGYFEAEGLSLVVREISPA